MKGLQQYFVDNKRVNGGRKGRSLELLSRRDLKLAYRFYYYCQIRKEPYESTISLLELEFDIRERVIIDRLRCNQETLDKLFQERPNTSILRKEIPYMMWN